MGRPVTITAAAITPELVAEFEQDIENYARV
jgi:hypothetical protein